MDLNNVCPYLKFLFAVAAVSFMVVSCQNDDADSNVEIDTVESFVSSDMDEQEILLFESTGAHQECQYDILRKETPECATITSSGDEFPKVITIDFGDGCVDDKGKTKSGKIIISESASLVETGAVRTITFDEFSGCKSKLEGTRTITNSGINDNGNIVFLIQGEITGAGKKGKTKTFTMEKEWIEGSETCQSDDDEFLVTGVSTMSCKRQAGSKTVIEPIHIAPGQCEYPLSGKVSIQRKGKTSEIDFGDGTCDNIATVTKSDGSTEEINLDERMMTR